jgi:histidine kinase
MIMADRREADNGADAVSRMQSALVEKEHALKKQIAQYQGLFESVPCLITVQDRNFRMLQFNRKFAEKFNPKPNDFCFSAYKGREEKCEDCPVEKTFQDGNPHSSEEAGINKDGTRSHWVVRTAPIKDETGAVVAAMEMSLDITQQKQLEAKVAISEQKYHAIFNHMPNPVFVLEKDTLKILDCNESVRIVYGFEFRDIINHSFLHLFRMEDRDFYRTKLLSTNLINQARHTTGSGKEIYVDIRISPSRYPGREVLLVTTSDITKRLETEQQLIQASKMATLGEMATGIAHELNQPLSVMKTASSFMMRKLNQPETMETETLSTMLGKIDSNVDRATKIINHMRQFARKSDLGLEPVSVNRLLENAFEIFSEQLKLRGIDVVWKLGHHLSRVPVNPSRLEQVFANLLVNARDAIEEKWGDRPTGFGDKRITIATRAEKNDVVVEIHDTGAGIPEPVADRIFEPFFTTKAVGKGTGLGLSISYGIIKESNGTIRAGTSTDGGACITIKFPVSDRS